jgi:hypothetical protein
MASRNTASRHRLVDDRPPPPPLPIWGGDDAEDKGVDEDEEGDEPEDC